MTTQEKSRRLSRTATSVRKFGLLDAMILVGAAAIGLVWWRESASQHAGFLAFFISQEPGFRSFLTFQHWFLAVFPILVPATLATILLRLRRPRPSLRRMVLQPGAVACLAALVAFSIFLARYLAGLGVERLCRRTTERSWISDWEPGAVDPLTPAAFSGVAVLAAWLHLRLGHRWRPEASWVDRSGRLLGIAWIAIMPVQVALEILWMLAMHGYF